MASPYTLPGLFGQLQSGFQSAQPQMGGIGGQFGAGKTEPTGTYGGPSPDALFSQVQNSFQSAQPQMGTLGGAMSTPGSGMSVPTNPAYGTNPWATPNGTQQGADFLAYRASQVPTFTMGADGSPIWNMPTMNNLGMGPTPPGGTPGITSSPGGFDAGATNPYLSTQADDIQRRVQQMMGQTMAGIQGNAVGVGGLGGSRQGVAQGIAASQGMDNLAGQLANLYGGAFENQQNRGLQQYGMNLNYGLGARGQDIQSQLGNRNIDLNRYTADQGFFTSQRGQDLQQAALGANLWNLGTNGAWNPINNANGVYGSYTGFGPSSATTSAGGGWQGAVGGGLTGLSFARQMGWI